MARAIVHPRLMDALENFYVQRCTFQQLSHTQDAYGQLVEDWADVAGLIGIPCNLWDRSGIGDEKTANKQITTLSPYRVALQGLYLAVTTIMRVVIDNISYNISGIEHDSQRTATYINCERVQ